jgi:hypothetical protein
MHAGDVPSSAAHVVMKSEFLTLAKKLATNVEDHPAVNV